MGLLLLGLRRVELSEVIRVTLVVVVMGLLLLVMLMVKG